MEEMASTVLLEKAIDTLREVVIHKLKKNKTCGYISDFGEPTDQEWSLLFDKDNWYIFGWQERDGFTSVTMAWDQANMCVHAFITWDKKHTWLLVDLVGQ